MDTIRWMDGSTFRTRWAYDAREHATNPHLVPEFSHLGQ